MSPVEDGGKPVPAEPDNVRQAFERDPLAAAREAVVRLTVQQAERGARSPAERAARAVTAACRLSFTAADPDVAALAGQQADLPMLELAFAPVTDHNDVAHKVAIALREVAIQGGSLEPSRGDQVLILLLAGALADLTLLRAGPIVPPDGADAVISSDADIARWRRAAAEAER